MTTWSSQGRVAACRKAAGLSFGDNIEHVFDSNTLMERVQKKKKTEKRKTELLASCSRRRGKSRTSRRFAGLPEDARRGLRARRAYSLERRAADGSAAAPARQLCRVSARDDRSSCGCSAQTALRCAWRFSAATAWRVRVPDIAKLARIASRCKSGFRARTALRA